MTTRASFNGTSAAEMEFEATHYSNPEMEEEWESPEGHPYSNPYSNPEMEEEWESPEGHPYSNPYSNPEFEDEAELLLPSPKSHPYTNLQYENEIEVEVGCHLLEHQRKPQSNTETAHR